MNLLKSANPFARKSAQGNFREPNLPPNPNEQATGLSMFGGVFTPSILTILGVIMYLRFGWVVGQVGLIGTLIIVTLSTSITFFTGLSIAEIATDRVIKAGGAYYMISRSLGIEVGGAVGIPLYIAQTLSMALYVIGFAESVAFTFPTIDPTLIGVVTALLVTGVAMLSASFAMRIQYFIMAAIVLSLLSFFFGHPVSPLAEGIPDAVTEVPKESFWAVFAVFFPAVTGIMSGVSMSGDLKDPKQSIPGGTLAAIAVGYLIYMVIPLFLYRWAPTEVLLSDPLVMERMARWGGAILLGVWGATLSSALGSILGAPRTLQALARDQVLPTWLRWLGAGTKDSDEPRIGTVVTLVPVLAAIVLGDLNLLAPILTMFFLTTYMVLNVAAGLENFLNSPSFRPSFRVHWIFSVLGAVGCLAVMFLIDAMATVMAAAIVTGVFVWLKQRELSTAWGDVRRGFWMALARHSILELGHDPHADTRNWRPNLLVLSGIPRRRWPMIELASLFTHNRGLITIASILPLGSRDADQQLKAESTIRDYLEERGVQSLVRLVMAEDSFEGSVQFVRSYGLGPLVPNTIMLGASQQSERLDDYCKMLQQFHEAKRNVLLFQENSDRIFGQRRRIDIWIRDLQGNGGLMLLLAYLLKTSLSWQHAEIRLKLVVPSEAAANAAEQNLKALIQQLRIQATVNVIATQSHDFATLLGASSCNADLIFLGLPKPGQDFRENYENLQQAVTGLPTTIFVLAAPDFEFKRVLST